VPGLADFADLVEIQFEIQFEFYYLDELYGNSKTVESKRLPSFTINSNSIKEVEFTKSLGVYIDENLT